MAEVLGQVTRSDVIGYTCDACGVQAAHLRNVKAQHFSWGNDSCDSIQVFHYCSGKCLKDIIRYRFIESEFFLGYNTSVLNAISRDTWKYLLGLD
jgi:hypothetical protein